MIRLPFFLAKRFVAGEDFPQAAPKVKGLNSKGLKATLDLLGENVTDREMADATTRAYCDLLDDIREEDLDTSISIKPTMLGMDIDYNYCVENVFTLLDKAKKYNQFVRIDMEGSDYTQRTIDMFLQAKRQYDPHVGIVLQAYLHRTREDVDLMIREKSDVRLCKGAYKEPAGIALQNIADIRAVFKEHAGRLMESTNGTRIATHDDTLIDWTRKYAEDNNIPKSRFEFQMLYGLRQETCEKLAGDGYHVRIYVPFGTMWLPYFTRRLRERKENIRFILSTMFKR